MGVTLGVTLDVPVVQLISLVSQTGPHKAQLCLITALHGSSGV